MKTTSKIISFLLIISLFAGCLGINASATDLMLPDYRMSDSEWNAYWNEVKGDNTQIALTPGKDATELNFNWHSERKITIPKVKISKDKDMSDAKVFNGYALLADNKQQRNRVTVTGLEENTMYYYSYSTDGKVWSEPEFYRTLGTDRFKALLVGDIQCSATEDEFGDTDAKNWNTTLNSALYQNKDTSFIISCGDQTQTGANYKEWAATLAPKAMRNLPMATTIGNHDHKGPNYKFYTNNPNSQLMSTSNTGTPYYFSYGDVLFVVFNTTNYNVFESQALAKKAIASHPDAKWRVALFHHDIYGTGHHAADSDNELLRGVYSAIMDEFQFDIALDGHEHYYGRSYFMKNDKVVDMDYSAKSVTDPEGTLYITTASASGKNRIYDEPYEFEWMNYSYMSSELIYCTVEFTDTTFKLETYTSDNKLIDEYTVTKTSSNYDDVNANATLLFDTDAVSRIMRYKLGDYYIIYQVVETVFDFARNIFKEMISSLI